MVRRIQARLPLSVSTGTGGFSWRFVSCRRFLRRNNREEGRGCRGRGFVPLPGRTRRRSSGTRTSYITIDAEGASLGVESILPLSFLLRALAPLRERLSACQSVLPLVSSLCRPSVPAILLLNESQKAWRSKAHTAAHRVVLVMPLTMKQLRANLEQLLAAGATTVHSRS
jgi:hypothetical protein